MRTVLDVRSINAPNIKHQARAGRGAPESEAGGLHTLTEIGDQASNCRPDFEPLTMSEDMRKWRPFLSSATSKLNNFKGYLASKDPRPLSSVSPPSQRGSGDSSGHGTDPGSGTRQSWTQWAGEKLRRAGQVQGDNGNAVEMVSLFPGWAARRLHTPSPGEGTWPSYAVHAGFLTVCHRHPF